MQKISMIALDWRTDPLGFRLQYDERDRPIRIVRKGGALAPCTSHNVESLYLEFAKVTGAPALLDFVNKFGPLTRAGLLHAPSTTRKVKEARGRRIEITETYAGDDVQEGLQSARWFMDVLRSNGDPRKLSTIFARSKPLRLSEGRLVLTPTGFSIQYQPHDLIQAMRVQLALALIDARRIAFCLRCNEPFETGNGKVRADAKYCCKEHKVEYLSLMRSRV